MPTDAPRSEIYNYNTWYISSWIYRQNTFKSIFQHQKVVIRKLYFQAARGPFQITKYFSSNLSNVQRYDYANGEDWKYIGTYFYLLPTDIYCEPIETTDKHYFNYKFSQLVSPFKKSLLLDRYNNKFLIIVQSF